MTREELKHELDRAMPSRSVVKAALAVFDNYEASQWRSKDELPQRPKGEPSSYVVLIEHPRCGLMLGYYSWREKKWLSSTAGVIEVCCWRPLPQPPEGQT